MLRMHYAQILQIAEVLMKMPRMFVHATIRPCVGSFAIRGLVYVVEQSVE